MRRFLLTLLASLAVLVGYAGPAAADLLYTLDQDHCTGGCGATPFGDVRLHQVASGDVQVTVTLTDSNRFMGTSGAGDAFLFNLTGFPDISGPGVLVFTTAGFALDPATSDPPNLFHADGTGSWMYGINCVVCGSGGSNPNAGPLVFDVNLAGLTVNDFIATTTGGNGNTGSNGNFFAVDLCSSFGSGPNGGCANTGDVAGNTPGAVVPPIGEAPEPGTLLLFGAGLLALANLRSKRRSSK